MRGAVVSGPQIVANVGGNLTIESRPDTARYRENTRQAHGSLGPSGASGGINSGRVRGDSTNVSEQSGLKAGDGGGVDLKGGMIISTADRSRNSLSADHLTYSDVVNRSRASAASIGLSFNGSGLPSPEMSPPVRQGSSGVARATLSPGNLSLRNQQHDLSGLNTEPARADTQAKPLDIERLKARQRNVAALSEIMNIGVGHLSKEFKLAEGSPEKVALHAAVGALTALASGGNVASGALAGGAQELVGAVIGRALADNPNLSQTERNALGQWAAVLVGAVTGGGSGAATALDAERYNRQLHIEEADLIRANAARYAVQRGYCQSAESCPQSVVDLAAGQLTSQAIKQTDASGAGLTQDDAAAAFLDSIAPKRSIPGLCLNCAQTFFHATGDQYQDASVNALFFKQIAPLYNLASKAYASEHTSPVDVGGRLNRSGQVTNNTRRTNDAVDRVILPWDVFNGLFAGAVGPVASRNGTGEREGSTARPRTNEASERVTEPGTRPGVVERTPGQRAEIAASKVRWVDENASMSSEARDFNDSATGARSNPLTRSGQAPAIVRTLDDGSTTLVRFDGLDDGVLVDRKLAVVTTDKARGQALRQSQALEQNGLTARWEVPNAQQATRAENMFKQLGITNITVRVIDHGR